MPNAPVKPGVILASLAHLATTKRKPDFLRLAWISRRPEAITAALKASIRALLLDLSSAGFCGRGLCALLMLWGFGGEADANLSGAKVLRAGFFILGVRENGNLAKAFFSLRGRVCVKCLDEKLSQKTS